MSTVIHTTDSLDIVNAHLSAGKAILLDVREQDEWNEGHLPQAVFLPLSRISTLRPGEHPPEVSSGKIVYVHCRAGRRALSAAERLLTLGIDVRPLKQGYDELVESFG